MATLPGWDSLGSVSSIHHWLELSGMGFLALLVLAEAFAFIYSGRHEVLTARAALAAEEVRRPEAADAERRTEKLPAQQASRRLTGAQRRVLTGWLAAFRGQKIDITCILGDPEAQQLAGDFVALFRDIGWDNGGGGGINQAVFNNDPTGVAVTLNTADITAGRVPPAANALIQALFEAGLVVSKQAFRNPQVSVDRVTLVIGRKPGG